MPDTLPPKRKRLLVIGDYSGKLGAQHQKTSGTIADGSWYSLYDQAAAEVRQKFSALDPALEVDYLPVPGFDTAQTAEAVRLAIESGRYDIVFHNTAPRKDQTAGHKNNHGEGLAYANVHHKNKEVLVVGVDAGNAESGNTFSHVRHTFNADVHKLFHKSSGSQFRSLYQFPHVTVQLAQGKTFNKKNINDLVPQPLKGAKAHEAHTAAERQFHLIEHHPFIRHGDKKDEQATIITPVNHHNTVFSDHKKTGKGPDYDTLFINDYGQAPTRGSFQAQATYLLALLGGTAALEGDEVAKYYGLKASEKVKRTFVVSESANLSQAERVYAATLDNGARIVTDDPTYFRLVRDRIKQVLVHAGGGPTLPDAGVSSFFPSAPEQDWELSTLEALNIPPLPELKIDAQGPQDAIHGSISGLEVAYPDPYGNLKTFPPTQANSLRNAIVGQLRQQGVEVKPEEGIKVTIATPDGHSIEGIISDSNFSVNEGQTSFSHGSSKFLIHSQEHPSLVHPQNKNQEGLVKTRGIEIFKRGASAAEALNYPNAGSTLTIQITGLSLLKKPASQTRGDDRTVTSASAKAITIN